MWRSNKIIVGLALLALVVVTVLLLHRKTSGTQQYPAASSSNSSASSGNEGEDVTVLLDFSASFAPYSPRDRLALKRIADGVAELATKWWKPPVTVTWRRIGTSSLLSRPICPLAEFSPRMVDGGRGVEALQRALKVCLDQATRESVHAENYTDISGAIAASVQSRESSKAHKSIIIFSDFKEDQAPQARPSSFGLDGQTVVMVHRPGTDETNMNAYLSRIQDCMKRFENARAARVIGFPLGVMTRFDLVQSMRPLTEPPGTAITILVDFKDRFDVGIDTETGDMAYLLILGKAVAKQAANWNPPVTLRLGVIGASALHMDWMPSQIFERKLVQAQGAQDSSADDPIRNLTDLEIAMDESMRGLRKFARKVPTTDLDGAIALAESGKDVEGRPNYLIVVSDFVATAAPVPLGLPVPLRGARVVMVYRPASKDAIDESAFFRRVEGWKKLFLDAGAQSACAAEMVTLTSQSLQGCLGN